MPLQKAPYVYARTDAIHLFSLAETVNGLTLQRENPRMLGPHVGALEFGAAALAALNEHELDAREEQHYSRYLKRVLRKCGFSGQRQFERGAKNVAIQVVDGETYVIPSKPYGRGGYLGLTEREAPNRGIVQCPLDPTQLGAAILGRIAVSVPHPE